MPEAVSWLRAASSHGDARAMVVLGVFHLWAEGLPRSPANALALFKRAVEGGSPEAAFLIGLCFERGEGVQENAAAAEAWYAEAAAGGCAQASFSLGRRAHAAAMAAAAGHQRQAAAAAAERHYRCAATSGHGGAMLHLGRLILPPAATPDAPEAASWFARAALDHGNAAACTMLAMCLLEARGLAADEAGALRWLHLGARRGDATAQYYLGRSHARGLHGIRISATRARSWWLAAARAPASSRAAAAAGWRGHPAAQLALGESMVQDGPAAGARGRPHSCTWVRVRTPALMRMRARMMQTMWRRVNGYYSPRASAATRPSPRTRM